MQILYCKWKMYIFFVLAFLVTITAGQGANRVECDPNASIVNGCFLRDYDQQWITSNCTTGYVLTSLGTCVQPCPTGKYIYGTQCLSCTGNCNSCYGPESFQCNTCSLSYNLNFQGLCSLNCDVSHGTYGLPQTNASPNTCQACDTSCDSCFHSYETACTVCSAIDAGGNTYRLKTFWYSKDRTNSGYCIRDPSAEFSSYFRQYPKDKLVTECPPGCSKCDDRFKCTACKAGFSLYPPAAYKTEYALCYADPT